MPHHVYILVSVQDPSRHYTGLTAQDPQSRLGQHNNGQVAYTSKHRPWRLETWTTFSNKRKAIAFERYLKSGSGREFARRHF